MSLTPYCVGVGKHLLSSVQILDALFVDWKQRLINFVARCIADSFFLTLNWLYFIIKTDFNYSADIVIWVTKLTLHDWCTNRLLMWYWNITLLICKTANAKYALISIQKVFLWSTLVLVNPAFMACWPKEKWKLKFPLCYNSWQICYFLNTF